MKEVIHARALVLCRAHRWLAEADGAAGRGDGCAAAMLRRKENDDGRVSRHGRANGGASKLADMMVTEQSIADGFWTNGAKSLFRSG